MDKVDLIRVDVHIHGLGDVSSNQYLILLDQIKGIRNVVERIFQQGEMILAKVDELKAELEEINNITNEIADDIGDLLGRLVEGGLTPEETTEIQGKIQELKVRLLGIASQHNKPTTLPA